MVQKVPESEIFGRSLLEYLGEISSSVSPVIIFPRHSGSSCHCQKQDPKLEELLGWPTSRSALTSIVNYLIPGDLWDVSLSFQFATWTWSSSVNLQRCFKCVGDEQTNFTLNASVSLVTSFHFCLLFQYTQWCCSFSHIPCHIPWYQNMFWCSTLQMFCITLNFQDG